ncbi:MAG: hypothetical protein IKN07_02380 [Lachnospiraceae bacterium]|nr:hypothetical protein [Lachnospiraceae bacterium]
MNHIAQYGLNNIPLDIKVKLAEAMTVYRMTFETAYALYGKYVGNWGGKATTFKFEAVKDGKVVQTVVKSAVGSLTLDVNADHTVLRRSIAARWYSMSDSRRIRDGRE